MQKEKSLFNKLKGRHICIACGNLTGIACNCKKGTTTKLPAEMVTFLSVSEMNDLFGSDTVPDYEEIVAE